MIFRETGLEGLKTIELDRNEDERGYFARTWCREEFTAHGIDIAFSQCSTSFNRHRGTLRGLHFQAPPHGEAKLVRCTRGCVFDVAVDLRSASPTRGQWRAVELSAATGNMFFIPDGFAHGFQTLEDDTEIFYQISTPYSPASARGIRWDDADLAIDWPVADPILSDKDRGHPPVRELAA
jgi:dTDP-4-dehydrorhamnose 3,5-epimerase